MARRKPTGRRINGWLVIDKPAGMTSTHVVAEVKRLTQAQKVGHGGTLDPLATGVLPIAMGEATKTVAYIMDARKAYEFTLRFGEARDTDDAAGAVIATSDRRPSDDEIRAALPQFIGLIQQVPPQYAAVKVQGERAYDIARRGETVELAAREMRIDELELVARPDADHGDVPHDLRQGRLCPRDRPRSRRGAGLPRACGGPAADRGRRVPGRERASRSNPWPRSSRTIRCRKFWFR